MAKNETRVEQRCDACGQTDDHPRHTTWTGAEFRSLHLDCCRAESCPACTDSLADAGDARGLDLLNHIQKKG